MRRKRARELCQGGRGARQSGPSLLHAGAHTSGAPNCTHLGDAALVPEQHADAGGRHTLARQLANLLNHLLRGGLAPAGCAALVGEGGGAEPLALGVHTTHSDGFSTEGTSLL